MTNEKDNRILSQSIAIDQYFAKIEIYDGERFQAYSINFITNEC